MSIFLCFFELKATWKWHSVPLWIPLVSFRIEFHITDLKRGAFAWYTRKIRKPPSIWWLQCPLPKTVSEGCSQSINCPLRVVWPCSPVHGQWSGNCYLSQRHLAMGRPSMMKMMMIMMTVTTDINLTLIIINWLIFFVRKMTCKT